MYPTGQRKRIRVLFTTGSLTDNTVWLDTAVTIGLFANIDAYTNSLQAISRKTVQLKNNCYDANFDPFIPCSSVLGVQMGTFILQRVTDNYLEAVFSPQADIAFDNLFNANL